MKKLFSERPCIRGEKLELRPLGLQDADGLRELTASDESYRYLPTFLLEKQFDDAEDLIRRLHDGEFQGSLILGVFYDGAFCGLAEFYGYRAPLLKISVGYRLLPRFWGKGIATKALGLMADTLFCETNVKNITASVMPDNRASARVLEKNGFRCVARSVLENWGYPLPTRADKWVQTAADYRRRHQADAAGNQVPDAVAAKDGFA